MSYKTEKKWLRTNEDWYPAIPGNNRSPNKEYDNPFAEPAVYAKTMRLSNGLFRICVWGGDDFGMEFDTVDAGIARQYYRELKDYTTQAQLRHYGYRPA